MFIKSDEFDAAWALFTPLLKEIKNKKIVPKLYPYGNRGPVGAHYLAARHNVRWGRCWGRFKKNISCRIIAYFIMYYILHLWCFELEGHLVDL